MPTCDKPISGKSCARNVPQNENRSSNAPNTLCQLSVFSFLFIFRNLLPVHRSCATNARHPSRCRQLHLTCPSTPNALAAMDADRSTNSIPSLVLFIGAPLPATEVVTVINWSPAYGSVTSTASGYSNPIQTLRLVS